MRRRCIKRLPFVSVAPRDEEVRAELPGDDLVPDPDSVMDRGFTVPGDPGEVWPWLVQLGKQRAGWYLPAALEHVIPRSRRATRVIDSRWQGLAVGDVIPDYGGLRETFEAVVVQAPTTLVYRSQRRGMRISWAIVLGQDELAPRSPATRVHLRLRLGPVRRRWLVDTLGELVDFGTVAVLAAGLNERLNRG